MVNREHWKREKSGSNWLVAQSDWGHWLYSDYFYLCTWRYNFHLARFREFMHKQNFFLPPQSRLIGWKCKWANDSSIIWKIIRQIHLSCRYWTNKFIFLCDFYQQKISSSFLSIYKLTQQIYYISNCTHVLIRHTQVAFARTWRQRKTLKVGCDCNSSMFELSNQSHDFHLW